MVKFCKILRRDTIRRRGIPLFIFLAIFGWSLATSARHGWHDHDQPYDCGGHWQQHSSGYHHERDSLPFTWHDHHSVFMGRHLLERIHDREFIHRFPGLHAYRWYGDGRFHHGFWHHGHYVRDALLFFDRDGELVSFGYLADAYSSMSATMTRSTATTTASSSPGGGTDVGEPPTLSGGGYVFTDIWRQ